MKSGERERERRKKRSFSGTEGEGEGIKALRGPIPLTARSLSHARIDLQGFLVPVSSIVGTRRVDGLLHGRLSSAAPCIGASKATKSFVEISTLIAAFDSAKGILLPGILLSAFGREVENSSGSEGRSEEKILER